MNYLKKYPLTIVCLGLIWYFSIFFVPPQTSLNSVKFMDKWVHFVMYGGTCAVLWIEYLHRHRNMDSRKLFTFAIVLPILMGGIVEIVQGCCTENRSGDWLDFLADSVGVVLAAIFGYFILPHIIKHKK